ncbi:hypothetical protein AVEN_6827-1 [Araneus ventricosus]|uniref:Uncharacterized protein n=1 Tax=Araneus ventricosus TaxID=182803 RepID=A0A4Y2ESW2_ARAVE|nr:hypothetical protein AVEN_6827-1 [Araneus ventricosus]
MAWDAYRADHSDTKSVDTVHCARLVDVYVTLIISGFLESGNAARVAFRVPSCLEIKGDAGFENTQKAMKCIRFRLKNLDGSLEKLHALDKILPVWNFSKQAVN